MGNIIWKRVKPLKESNSIKLFELEHKIILPDNVKSFIVKNNGGRPDLDVIKTMDGNELEVKALLSFNKEDTESIYNVIDYFKRQFNSSILPIASESSGDYFCIDLTSESIMYWNQDTNKLTFVASNFGEFLNRLYKL